ncbi:hypothetical protein [Clostridium culturomicium]|uniref:hypothetical protein n=1 Tax=Clostridium culturomicium TaxID=1499683 RepID=UPI00058F05B2|nr:hypothetical protein [Clostridium culturomicium]
MKIINLKEGMELYYINNDNVVKKCTYEYTNKNGKKYVSFINKRGGVSYAFLPRGTEFFSCEDEALKRRDKIILKIYENEKLAKERELEYKLNRKRYEEEGRIALEDILSKVENVNRLPLWEVVEELDNNYELNIDGYDVLTSNFNEEFLIADGTKIVIKDGECFNKSSGELHNVYWFVPEIETYICIECGLWQKYYTDLFNEVSMEFEDTYYYEEKMLPWDWNKEGVKAYFRNGIKYEIDKNYKELDEFL